MSGAGAGGGQGRSGSTTAIACMALAMVLLPAGDVFAKLLTGVLEPLVVAMWRLAAQALCLVPVAILLRGRLRGAMFSPVVALSGILMMITLTSLIGAFAVMPIATAIAIFFVEPLILTLLAGPFLGETPGPRRLAAVAVGFAGALIVIRPGLTEFGWAAVLPIVAATGFAVNMIVLRRAGATRSGLTIQCGATLYAAAIMIVAALALHGAGVVTIAPAAMPGWSWGAIAAAGVLAAASFLLIAEAFRQGEASTLAPLQYLEIIGATAAGYLVFGDFPDPLTWLGVTIILGSGFYIYRRERLQTRQFTDPLIRRR